LKIQIQQFGNPKTTDQIKNRKKVILFHMKYETLRFYHSLKVQVEQYIFELKTKVET